MRLKSGWVFLGLIVLASTASRAQPSIFEDDFERASESLMPGPGWTGVSTNVTGTEQSLNIVPVGSHRGSGGLRLLDTEQGAPEGATYLALQRAIGSPLYETGSSRFIRLWMRFNPAVVAGFPPSTAVHLIQFGSGEVKQELRVVGTNLISCFGTQRGGGLRDDGTSAVVAGWHLYELYLEGLGTTNGARSLWIDGRIAQTRTGLDFAWPTIIPAYLDIGTHYMTADWAGFVDFDDLRISASAPGSTLSFESSSLSLSEGQCAAVVLRLNTSRNQPVVGGTPTALRPRFSVSGGLQLDLFSDTTCQTPLGPVMVPAGTMGPLATVYVRAQPGAGQTATLVASDDDFIAGSLPITLVAASGVSDAGTIRDAGSGGTAGGNDGGTLAGSGGGAPPRGSPLLGCSASGVWWASMLALFFWPRRRFGRHTL